MQKANSPVMKVRYELKTKKLRLFRKGKKIILIMASLLSWGAVCFVLYQGFVIVSFMKGLFEMIIVRGKFTLKGKG